MTLPSDSIEAQLQTILEGIYPASGAERPEAERAARALADRAREAERERGISDEAGLDLARELQVAEREAKALREALDLIANGEYYETAEEIARATLAASESSDG